MVWFRMSYLCTPTMADIFISYSRQDSQHALSLVEQLRSNGLSVWIDQHGIEAATSWSKEIAEALEACHTVLLLLSGTAIASKNVAKELSVATQLNKRIVPVQIERVELRGEFLYHLASLQRVKITDLDGIVRAIGKTESAALNTSATPVRPVDDRKSLMILPFEDLSPTADNEWFTNGIVSELIQSLSYVKALKVMDAQTTKEFKKYNGHLTIYAKEMGVRYFVQGDVRKFGDNIKINSRLLDIETGDHLWQDSLKGTMEDIFDIQETVAKRVLEGLQVLLASEEKSKLEERGTNNAEAYEFYIRSGEVIDLNTLEGFRQVCTLSDRAIELDPNYIAPYRQKAQALVTIFEHYERNVHLLDEAQDLLEKADKLSVHPQLTSTKAKILYLRGDVEGAERTFKEMIQTDPNNYLLYNGLGYFYYTQQRHNEAFEAFVNSIKCGADSRIELWNTSINAFMAGKHEDFFYWSEKAIPEYRRYVRLYPDDLQSRRVLASLLFFRGQNDESLRELEIIESKPNLDAVVLYSIAQLRAARGEYSLAIERLREAVSAGFVNKGSIQSNKYFKPLLTMPEFTTLMDEMDKRIAATGNG